jgi:hypothetical protein
MKPQRSQSISPCAPDEFPYHGMNSWIVEINSVDSVVNL